MPLFRKSPLPDTSALGSRENVKNPPERPELYSPQDAPDVPNLTSPEPASTANSERLNNTNLVPDSNEEALPNKDYIKELGVNFHQMKWQTFDKNCADGRECIV